MITYYIIGLLISASLLMGWAFTTAPLHLYPFLSLVIPNKGMRQEFRHLMRSHVVTTEQWEDTINLYLPPLIASLLTCIYCFSFHVAMWVAVALYILTPVDWTFIPLSALSQPILINILLKLAK